MHVFNLKAEQAFDSKRQWREFSAGSARGNVASACWELGQNSPYHCHPNATEIYFCLKVAAKCGHLPQQSISRRDPSSSICAAN